MSMDMTNTTFRPGTIKLQDQEYNFLIKTSTSFCAYLYTFMQSRDLVDHFTNIFKIFSLNIFEIIQDRVECG